LSCKLDFDTNGDGKLTAADAAFAQFKVLVPNADGSTTVMTLAQLGITEINSASELRSKTDQDKALVAGLPRRPIRMGESGDDAKPRKNKSEEVPLGLPCTFRWSCFAN
jgi:hypothetical protein